MRKELILERDCIYHVFVNSAPKKPHRLEYLFPAYSPALYFITVCTFDRKAILANPNVHEQFDLFCRKSCTRGIAFGRYVIMPDHIHCFVRVATELKIGTTIRLLKRSLSSKIESAPPHWQPGFFDRVIRRGESYADKWEYVRMNPVRKGLVRLPEEWPFQG